MNLLVEYVETTNVVRNAEYLYCLHENLKNRLISKIHLFVSGNVEFHFESENFEIIHCDCRPSYKDLFDYCNANLPGELCIVANADIIFDRSLSPLVNFDFEYHVLAVSRWDMVMQPQGIKIQFHDSAASQDSWIFRSPVPTSDEMHIYMGMRGCDNKIAKLLYDQGCVLKNPGKILITRHFHFSQFRTYRIKHEIPGPYLLVIPTDDLESEPIYSIIEGFDDEGKPVVTD